MAKQTFTTGQVLTAAQMTSLQQTAMGGGEATAKTASYVLVAADAGTTVIMNAAGATTITVNTALFAAGDTVNIQNIGAGICTVTAGTATVNTAGSLALNQYEGGVLYFRSASASTFFDYVQTGATSPLTTKGDVWGYSTVDARIPVGTNNQVLTADSAQALGVKWATPTAAAFVGCSVYASAAQSLANSTLTVLAFDSEYYDTDSMHDNATNNSRITVPTGQGGKYLLTGNIVYAPNATGFRQFFIRINGSGDFYSASNPTEPGYASFPNYVAANFVLNLSAGQYVELFGFQSSGGALNVNGGDKGVTYFQLSKIG